LLGPPAREVQGWHVTDAELVLQKLTPEATVLTGDST